MPGRVIGFYALSVMAAEGPLYGYQLAERIAARTEGAWRPGAGAIYPALESLTRRGHARATRSGRRRVYRITAQGRAFLREVRRNIAWRARGGPDLTLIWAEVAGPEDPALFLLESFRRRLQGVVGYFATDRPGTARHRALRAQLRADLELAIDRLADPAPSAGRRSRRSG